MLLADMMTKKGELNGTTRYGIVGEKKSVLARSAFEETKNTSHRHHSKEKETILMESLKT